MPIYEYLCPQCNGRFQKLVRSFADPSDLACPRCASTQVRRAVSQVAVLKSEESRAEALADPGMFAGLDENDPKSIAQWARKLGRELGEEAGDDWDQMVDEMLEDELHPKDPGAADAPDPADPDAVPAPVKPRAAPDNLGWG